MPLITTVHESLPYIDPEPTPPQRAAAEALITAERAAHPDDPHHALLPTPYTPTFLTPALTSELARAASTPRRPLKAIDLTRYQTQDAPSTTTALSPADAEAALSRARASATYLASRRAHLALLDSHGKNAWLVGNHALEGELRALEGELAAARRDVDVVVLARQRAQGDVAGEMRGLDEGWRRGVGRVLETEVAVESVRRQVQEVRREQS